ncbi:MAG TPA: hypothetical protein VEK08_18635 [Planctomycetota bacterium]|nr:hypothetical protein [Planctomycetota bacterium]
MEPSGVAAKLIPLDHKKERAESRQAQREKLKRLNDKELLQAITFTQLAVDIQYACMVGEEMASRLSRGESVDIKLKWKPKKPTKKLIQNLKARWFDAIENISPQSLAFIIRTLCVHGKSAELHDILHWCLVDVLEVRRGKSLKGLDAYQGDLLEMFAETSFEIALSILTCVELDKIEGFNYWETKKALVLAYHENNKQAVDELNAYTTILSFHIQYFDENQELVNAADDLNTERVYRFLLSQDKPSKQATLVKALHMSFTTVGKCLDELFRQRRIHYPIGKKGGAEAIPIDSTKTTDTTVVGR